MKVSELRAGARKVDVIVKVVKKNTPRTVFVKTDGQNHSVADLLVGDDTGVINLSLWDNHINLIKEEDVIQISNGYVGEFGGKLQLNIGRYGQFERLDPGEHKFDVYLEAVETSSARPPQYVQVVDTLRKQRGINIIVKVIDQLPERAVTTKQDQKQHIINTFIVGDETGIINFVLWDKGDDIAVGDVLEIQGGYTREFNKILELNLSKFGSYEKSSEGIEEINTDRNISEPSS